MATLMKVRGGSVEATAQPLKAHERDLAIDKGRDFGCDVC
jgi:hypothetical protein